MAHAHRVWILGPASAYGPWRPGVVVVLTQAADGAWSRSVTRRDRRARRWVEGPEAPNHPEMVRFEIDTYRDYRGWLVVEET